MPFSCPLSSNDINNCSVLASPETSDDCDEVTDDLMESSSCRDEMELPAPNSVSLNSLSKTVSDQAVLPDANPANGTYYCYFSRNALSFFVLCKDIPRLSAEDVINVIEHHPQKDEILSMITKKYISLSFSLNGKVCMLNNNSCTEFYLKFFYLIPSRYFLC